MEIKLIQTLQDRDNPDEIESDGPFVCRKKHAWLGAGYYFWDTHEELGHWWGRTVYGEGKYVITNSNGIIDKKCWDLHGNGQHRIEFRAVCDEIVKKGITSKDNITVPQVIEYLKVKKILVYNAIRALGVNSIGDTFKNRIFVFRVPFIIENSAFLDIYPPVQICLIEKKALSLSNFKIIYPEYYCEDIYV